MTTICTGEDMGFTGPAVEDISAYGWPCDQRQAAAPDWQCPNTAKYLIANTYSICEACYHQNGWDEPLVEENIPTNADLDALCPECGLDTRFGHKLWCSYPTSNGNPAPDSQPGGGDKETN